MGRTADAGPGRDQPDEARPRQLADEQAALRRVATLVASGALPSEVFSAVADELGQLIGVEATFVCRVDLPRVGPPGAAVADPSGERAEPEGYVTVAASYGRIRDEVPVGFRVKLSPGMVMTIALRTGRPARINGERLAKGPLGAIVGRLGLRAGVATPVVAGGRYWGVTVAATSQEDFPADTESRMADFMELAGMAIANAEAEERRRELADTQASLRRLAMLVARGESPEAVFAAVTREALRHFGNGTARMIRFELDGTATGPRQSRDIRRRADCDRPAPAARSMTTVTSRAGNLISPRGYDPRSRCRSTSRAGVGNDRCRVRAGAIAARHRAADDRVHRAGRDSGRECTEPG